jgi:hypothetical protein
MISLRVAAWSAWAPGIETPDAWREWAKSPIPPADGGPPGVNFLPAMQRRRCDPLTRALLESVNACYDEAVRANAACVFASRHGPFGTMIALLEGLARGDAPSPARFSHSVHNTQAGLFSIWAKNTQPSTSLAAAGDTFAHGLLDAAGLLHRQPDRKVLLICGDEPIPESIAPKADHQHGLHVLTLLLDHADGVGDPLSIELARSQGDANTIAVPDPLVFLRWWLLEEPTLTLDNPPRGWTFSRG